MSVGRFSSFVVGCIALSAIAANTAVPLAQTASPGGGTVPKTTSVPPYETQLLRLSEILGAVHYLSSICKTNETAAWREQMTRLIEAEKPEPERRRRLVDQFNRGYRGFSDTYLRCTPSAELAFDRYITEGADIAKEIVTRYAR